MSRLLFVVYVFVHHLARPLTTLALGAAAFSAALGSYGYAALWAALWPGLAVLEVLLKRTLQAHGAGERVARAQTRLGGDGGGTDATDFMPDDSVRRSESDDWPHRWWQDSPSGSLVDGASTVPTWDRTGSINPTTGNVMISDYVDSQGIAFGGAPAWDAGSSFDTSPSFDTGSSFDSGSSFDNSSAFDSNRPFD